LREQENVKNKRKQEVTVLFSVSCFMLIAIAGCGDYMDDNLSPFLLTHDLFKKGFVKGRPPLN